MLHRFRLFRSIVLTGLIVLLLMGPPLSIASNLPTACNIFGKKAAGKAGPCGYRAMYSKIQDKSFEVEGVLSFNAGLETTQLLVIQNSPTSFLLPLENNTQSPPLLIFPFSPGREPQAIPIFSK
jgi:hypothetical protein